MLGFIDPQWAIPANTALLALVAYWQARNTRKLHDVEKDAKDAKRKVGAVRRHDSLRKDSGERRRWDD